MAANFSLGGRELKSLTGLGPFSPALCSQDFAERCEPGE